MTKIADVEADLIQHKIESNDRLARLEKSMESLEKSMETRLEELRQLLLTQQKNDAPTPTIAGAPLSNVSGTPVAPALTVATQPPPITSLPIIHASQPIPNGNNFPPPFSYVYPAPVGVNTHGVPVYTAHEADSSYTPYFGQPTNLSLPPFAFDQVSAMDTVMMDRDSGLGRGPGPPADRTWLASSDYRLRKLKMPIFDGNDAFGWVYRMERYFDIQGFITTGEKMRAAVLCLEGQALAWYRWANSRAPFRHWDGFKERLLERFQPSHEGDIYEQFLAIKQEGSVRDYIGLFETLAAQLVGIPERVMEGTFIKGLNAEIRTSVRLLQPIGLTQTIKTALLADEGRSTSSDDSSRRVAQAAFHPLLKPTPTSTEMTPTTRSSGTQPVTGVLKQPRRLTDSELAEKRAKGLCYRCDGKFSPGHRCPDKSLYVLLMADDVEVENEEFERQEARGQLDTVKTSTTLAGFPP